MSWAKTQMSLVLFSAAVDGRGCPHILWQFHWLLKHRVVQPASILLGSRPFQVPLDAGFQTCAS